MKYLNKLFAFDDRKSQHQSSATLTSSLYSVTFVASESNSAYQSEHTNQTGSLTDPSAGKAFSHNRVTTVSHGEPWRLNALLEPITRVEEKAAQIRHQTTPIKRKTANESGLGGYLLTATIGKTIASTSAITPKQLIEEEQNKKEEEDDWILIDNSAVITTTKTTTTTTTKLNNKRHNSIRIAQLQQMALDKTDVELIKASWLPVRKDPVASGVLLFKGLFTKFPQYLQFFPQFSDLDIERIQEHKRLLRHAVKVVETVTFVVDSIGDESKTTQLNEALVNLVRGHLKRKIGLAEFRNLGIVLIDFICDVNNRRSTKTQLNKSSTGDSSNQSSNDSETMTSALDKIRTSSSPSSSSEEESYLAGKTITQNNNLVETNDFNTTIGETGSTKIDTNVLVAAWTKLYSSILDLVKREESQ